MQGKPINNGHLCQQCSMYLSKPTTAGLVVGVEAEESVIRVQEIEPKEAAVNKREGRVS